MKRWLFLVVALALNSSLAAAGDEGAREATVSTSNVTAVSARLGTGYKLIKCTVETHYRVGKSDVTSVTTDLTIPANAPWSVYVPDRAQYIAFILDSSTGTCNIFGQTNQPGFLPPLHVSIGHIVTEAATIALDGGGSASATVTAGTVCVCSIAATYTSAACTRSGTTLSITGSDPGRNVSYICST